MALIKDTTGRKETETPSAYERVFGNKKLGMLISKTHATSIREGTELEKILASKLKNTKGISIDQINKEKRIFKNVKRGHTIKIDCLIEKGNKTILIEIKDGDTFDTKKVAGEIESLLVVRDYLKKQNKEVELYFCSFNVINHEQIKKGTKNLLGECKPMTGKELCNMINVNYDEIIEDRKENQEENLNYFAQELKKIKEIMEILFKRP
jgi:hypothetical protein